MITIIPTVYHGDNMTVNARVSVSNGAFGGTHRRGLWRMAGWIYVSFWNVLSMVHIRTPSQAVTMNLDAVRNPDAFPTQRSSHAVTC